MKLITGSNFIELYGHMERAIEIALRSTCHRSKCGSVVVKDNKIIGWGFNSMPCGKKEACFKDSLPPSFRSDRTCCVHAEQRAIMDALRNHPEKILNSQIYFIRLDEHDIPMPSGDPYCTICSKLALDVGIAEFILLHKGGLAVYDTDEYNTISFQHANKPEQL